MASSGARPGAAPAAAVPLWTSSTRLLLAMAATRVALTALSEAGAPLSFAGWSMQGLRTSERTATGELSPPSPAAAASTPSPPFAGALGVAAAANSAGPGAEAVAPKKEAVGGLQAFWKFLRPHTIRGTILGSSAMVARVVLETGKTPDWTLLPTAALGVLALLCGNGYIVGINQIYDVSIDVINKPYLPVAAKELTVGQAWVLIGVMAVGGVGLAYSLFGPLIGSLYAFGLFLGTIYSVPPLRLKQSAIAAALIIATVRGLLLNFGVYYATRSMLRVPFTLSYPTAFITCFCTVFALVIAVTKDLPDVQGDRDNSIDTFATRFGVEKVATAATCVLAANYAQTLFWALNGTTGPFFRASVLLPSHGILALMLVRGLFRLRKAQCSMDAIQAFYRLIWLLFYSEYFLFPLI